ncbi:MAG: alpha/beta hydrolase family protein [Rikenellaceae bacterium]
MKIIRVLLVVVQILICANLYAAQVDTVNVYSPSMEREIRCAIVLPEDASSSEQLPAVYLLHGYSGNYKAWLSGFDTEELVDKYRVVAVIPDGNFDSWYLDSPINPKMQFETFISKELVAFVDSKYPTIPSREGRAISGLSMGGHGALYNAIRHQDVFGAVGSMSGGVDIRPFPHRWNIAKHIGSRAEYPENWEKFTVINQLHLLDPSKPLAMTIDCGVDDFFYEANQALHQELLYMNYPHRYTTDQGTHTKAYWKKSQHYHFLFFNDFFRSSTAK